MRESNPLAPPVPVRSDFRLFPVYSGPYSDRYQTAAGNHGDTLAASAKLVDVELCEPCAGRLTLATTAFATGNGTWQISEGSEKGQVTTELTPDAATGVDRIVVAGKTVTVRWLPGPTPAPGQCAASYGVQR